MSRRTMLASLLISIMAMFAVGADAEESTNANLTWQGRELTVITITTDESEITKVFKDPIPAEGFLVLARLSIVDGSVIAEDTAGQYGNEFLLTDAEGNVERPMEVFTDSGNLALIFYHRQWLPSDRRMLTLTVSPPEKAPDQILDARLTWQGVQLKVVSATDDRASFSGREWPANGYLLQVQFETEDGATIPYDAVAVYNHEIVLTDDNQRVYRAIDTEVPSKPGVFSLLYSIGSEPAPAMDRLALSVEPNAALWMDAYFREANLLALGAFSPKKPQVNTVAIALEDDSRFAYNSGFAIADPEGAFQATNAALQEIRSGLLEMFSGNSWTVADDPDLASVVIGVHIAYHSAGDYSVDGGLVKSLRAYDCDLTLTAFDAITKEIITSLRTGSHFGNSITTTVGASVVWKNVPSIADADDAQKDDFVSAMYHFWKTWEQP